MNKKYSIPNPIPANDVSKIFEREARASYTRVMNADVARHAQQAARNLAGLARHAQQAAKRFNQKQ